MRPQSEKRQQQALLETSLFRQRVLMVGVFACFAILGGRLYLLETKGHARLQAEADARHVRNVDISPVRGPILDRNDRILAVSTPVDTLWAEPKRFCQSSAQWASLTQIVGAKSNAWRKTCAQKEEAAYRSDFMYLKRQLAPAIAEAALQKKVPGVHTQRDYKRFYPTGPAASHMIGFVDIDSKGQEGIEKAFDSSLRGSNGKKTVFRDSKGRFVEFVEQKQAVEDGEALKTSLDSRLQYFASAYLEEAVRQHQASSGSAVLLKIPTGEILAIANSPQFNPNDRSSLDPDRFRNRAVADVQEPGSTIKPFTIAMALESGRYHSGSLVDTGKKPFRIRGGTVHDTKPHGVISVSDVVMVSSNIGAAKIALEFEPSELFETFNQVGFGHKNGGILAEVSGSLPKRKRPIEHATQAYGYGLNATTLQVARAYTAFATDGRLLPLTLSVTEQAPQGKRVFSTKTALAVRSMLEMVVSEAGTARLAKVDRYRVGGKTGTTHKLIDGNYKNKRYVSWFVGLAPISDPQFVLAIMIDDPTGEVHYGGSVAGPVFASLMKDALRLYNIVPDAVAERDKVADRATIPTGGGA